MALACTNCGRDVDPEQAKLFASVFVCPECNEIANRMLEVGEQELRRALRLLKQTIQASILTKSLKFRSPEEVVSSRSEVLQHLAILTKAYRQKMTERTCAQMKSSTPERTPSQQTTRLSAASVAGNASSSLLLVVDSSSETTSEKASDAIDASGR
jgi:predicted RNA-binding Zn-ribbon protein involved in translation (DUF1610 family)